jgi:hypothetical protein
LLRAEGRRGVDESAIIEAVQEQRRVLAAAQLSSKAARRAAARLPDGQPVWVTPPRAASTATAPESELEARVPPVAAADAWKTEFLP